MGIQRLAGTILVSGLAEGTLRFLPLAAEASPRQGTCGSTDSDAEVSRFRGHLTELVADLREAARRMGETAAAPGADILQAHILVLEGDTFRDRVESAIRETSGAAEAAVERAVRELVAVFEASGNPILAERAPDLRDLSFQLRQRLAGRQASHFSDFADEPAQCVLATRELLPSLVLEAQARGVRAFLVERGTPLSHGAILARSFGMPVLRLARIDLLGPREGAAVLVDAERGELVVEPPSAEIRAPRTAAPRREALMVRPSPLARVWLNVMDPAEVAGLDWGGVAGVGLYRTEVLFMGARHDLPGEEEQLETYRRLFAACGGRPATVRTLDIGGDKTLPYFSLGPQANPALGLRAHRIYRFHPEILVTQVRAILRAAHGFDGLRLLFPMIECVEEWRFVQGLVDRALASLRDEHRQFQEQFERGLMVEIPSAVWSFRRLLDLADFASVGTNDLVQYLFAVDRTNANVLRTYGPEHPIVLGILKQLASTARRAGKDLAVCGEIGGDPEFLPLLVGLGVGDVSVAVNRVEAVAARLNGLTRRDCRELARAALAAGTAEEVSVLLGRSPEGPRTPGRSGGDRDEEVDPICGMAVHTEGNPFSAERGGGRYFFCSPACMNAFLNGLS